MTWPVFLQAKKRCKRTIREQKDWDWSSEIHECSTPVIDYHEWLDHYEKRKEAPVGDGAADCWSKEGGYVHISQPYLVGGLAMEKLEQLIAECKDHDISFDIQPFSDHYPGQTIMFRWYPSKDKEKYRKIYMSKDRFKQRVKEKLFREDR